MNTRRTILLWKVNLLQKLRYNNFIIPRRNNTIKIDIRCYLFAKLFSIETALNGINIRGVVILRLLHIPIMCLEENQLFMKKVYCILDTWFLAFSLGISAQNAFQMNFPIYNFQIVDAFRCEHCLRKYFTEIIRRPQSNVAEFLL